MHATWLVLAQGAVAFGPLGDQPYWLHRAGSGPSAWDQSPRVNPKLIEEQPGRPMIMMIRASELRPHSRTGYIEPGPGLSAPAGFFSRCWAPMAMLRSEFRAVALLTSLPSYTLSLLFACVGSLLQPGRLSPPCPGALYTCLPARALTRASGFGEQICLLPPL